MIPRCTILTHSPMTSSSRTITRTVLTGPVTLLVSRLQTPCHPTAPGSLGDPTVPSLLTPEMLSKYVDAEGNFAYCSSSPSAP